MSGIATALVVGAGTSYLASKSAETSSEKAAEAQISAAETASAAEMEATQLAIEEQKRQFDAIQQLLSPYVEAGTSSLSQQLALVGLGGEQAQASAISAIESSPQFQALVESGEEAILQNASATGGLRGGNVQAALAEYRPSILSQLIESQYNKLAGITQLGQSSAAGVGSAGSTTSSNISQLLQQMGISQSNLATTTGEATAQSLLASGVAQQKLYGDINEAVGTAISSW